LNDFEEHEKKIIDQRKIVEESDPDDEKNDEDFNEDDSELDPEEEEDDSDEEEYINGKFKKVKKRRGNRNKVKTYSNSGRGAHLYKR
jgi:hypothetical protein